MTYGTIHAATAALENKYDLKMDFQSYKLIDGEASLTLKLKDHLSEKPLIQLSKVFCLVSTLSITHDL